MTKNDKAKFYEIGINNKETTQVRKRRSRKKE